MDYKQKDELLYAEVQRMINGDYSNFNAMYEMSVKYFYKLIFDIVKDHHTTEDLVQDTYVTIYSKISGLQNPRGFYSWAGRIATNNALMFLRKNRDVLLSGDEDDEAAEFVFERASEDQEQFIPEEIYMNKEKQRLLAEILDALPVEQKLCVQYFYYEAMSVQEIADAMGCSTGTVKSRLNYARKAIKEAVVELDVKHGTRLYSLGGAALLYFIFRGEVEKLVLNAASVAAGASSVTTQAHYASNSAFSQYQVNNSAVQATQYQPSGVNSMPSSAQPSGVNSMPSSAQPSGVNSMPSSAQSSGVDSAPSSAQPSGVNSMPSSAQSSGVDSAPSSAQPGGVNAAPSGTQPSGTSTAWQQNGDMQLQGAVNQATPQYQPNVNPSGSMHSAAATKAGGMATGVKVAIIAAISTVALAGVGAAVIMTNDSGKTSDKPIATTVTPAGNLPQDPIITDAVVTPEPEITVEPETGEIIPIYNELSIDCNSWLIFIHREEIDENGVEVYWDADVLGASFTEAILVYDKASDASRGILPWENAEVVQAKNNADAFKDAAMKLYEAGAYYSEIAYEPGTPENDGVGIRYERHYKPNASTSKYSYTVNGVDRSFEIEDIVIYEYYFVDDTSPDGPEDFRFLEKIVFRGARNENPKK